MSLVAAGAPKGTIIPNDINRLFCKPAPNGTYPVLSFAEICKPTAKDVLADLLGGEPFAIADPQLAALVILGHLRDAGFAVVP